MPGTVAVACKLPHGLVLQLQRMEKRTEPVMGGGYRDFEQAVRHGKRVVLAGFARPVNPEGEHDFAPTAGGYGLTYGVDKDFFEAWLHQNADLEVVRKGFVFAAEREDTVKGRAREGKAGLSGFEAINPREMPTEFQRIKPDDRR